MLKKHYIIISFIVFLALALLYSGGYFSNIQRTVSDPLYGGLTPLQNFVIVAIDDKSLQEIGRWPWDRSEIAQLYEVLNETRLIATDIGFFEETDADGVLSNATERNGKVFLALEYISFSQTEEGVKGENTLVPVDSLSEAAAGMGYINILTDRDGVTRAINTNVEGAFLSFPALIAKEIIKEDIPQENRVLINFVGPPKSYPTYSFVDIVRGEVDRTVFKDKIVFIGATSPDLHDSYFVPTSKGVAMPGVEILANAAQTLIFDNPIRPQSTTSVFIMIFILSMLVGLGFSYVRLRTVTIVTFLLMPASLFVAIIFFNNGTLLNIVYPILTLGVAFTSNLGYAYLRRKQQKEEIQRAFGKYVSKDVINEIMKDPKKLQLGGEHREITVFFSDIRGFTGISEKLSAEELVALLNEYLTHMTDIIIEEGGIVDKYMGDAIMAFWGAPLKQPDHAVRACKTNLKMLDRLTELQKDWSKRGIPVLYIGAGLNTGYCVVGNMGSTQRFDYTAMGDTVNLGSRLEGVNKQYGTTTLISESTHSVVKDHFATRKLDRIKVKGRDAPITIFELLAEKATTAQKSTIKHFESGLEKYWKQDWDGAIEEFRKALRVTPHDEPSRIFIERCEAFKRQPPGENWDGVLVMKTK